MADMKRIVLTLVLLAASAYAMQAQQIEDLELKRLGDWMLVKMEIGLADALPGANRTVVLSPELRSGQNRLSLKPLGIYSRNQWYYYQRIGKKAGESPEEISLRKGKAPAVFNYETMVPYRSWMDGAGLFLLRETKGCCGEEKSQLQERLLAVFRDETVVKTRVDTVYIDRPVYIERESRTRSINGEAFIDFPIGETVIQPSYHANKKELADMRATIESAMANPGWTIRKIWIKGHASPEGPYDKNEALAKGRTEAIRDYVVSLCRLDGSLMSVEYEAENWEGLRSFVEASSLPHRGVILEIIDGDRLPDDKEWMIKSRYPDDWNILLQQCLPYLRRTDYRIDYDVKENN